MNEKDIEFAGMVYINYDGIVEFILLQGIGKKTAENNIIKRNEFGRFSS